ncbi:hypothetical protein THMIRHAM_01020 [Thiomicrorhabdus immobilis]|uniref:Uncharacterized protein n=1 Tax=Thiomicrorhabdus immobilis TaxID=2791037 RepID=A0ABM7MAH0_9GAMM|nr:hypothetical protein [Thiomicrorhabdus immobilis]BCN92317.1 hypothetical protein THMIRHAM_01020 [Thiomicrorhabdus immobilis]
MELGSPEHKHLLMQGIIKVALKTISMGFILGVILMIPFLFRENAFSTGIAYLGLAILLGSLVYALVLVWKKYQRIIKPFDETYRSK